MSLVTGRSTESQRAALSYAALFIFEKQERIPRAQSPHHAKIARVGDPDSGRSE